MNRTNEEKSKPKILTIAAGKQMLATLVDAGAGLTYVVIGAYCWGADKNAATAAKNARSNGGRGAFTIHLANEGAEVDQVNGTLWHNSKFEGVKINIAHFRMS